MGRSVTAAAAPALALAGLAASVPSSPAGAVEAPAIMAGAERYCEGYEETFDGVWTSGAGAPVPFRVGVAPPGAEARACYAQLNVDEARRIAPYELRRYEASRGPGGVVWTLRYRHFEVEIDPARGTAAHRRGEAEAETGVLLPVPPPVAPAPPAPSPDRAERWYGKWKGRFPGVPFPVTLRLSESGPGEVGGELSVPLLSRSFAGRFHGGMLVFPWKNRHIGFSLEPDGGTLVHVSYKGEVFRLRRAS